ncbi:MAG: NAD(P)/FAD-dependent oxidoreductase [Vampirovibrio sp.]|nr:NAD(P)/FAD-dependent oxidoreductase [Vampirovibrio sp.]
MDGLSQKTHHVVIIGAGFGGLHAAQALGNMPGVRVTVIDKRNFHLFQPLLYQIATGALSAAEIASPIRFILNRFQNIQVLLGEVTGIDTQQQAVTTPEFTVPYDSLIVATGSRHHYFGNDHWEEMAPGLKTIEDAIAIRHKIFEAFEQAERTTDPELQNAWMTFVIVGGGPTGVEMAGAVGELAHYTLKNDFYAIKPGKAKIYLLEGMDRVLPPYDAISSEKAHDALALLGVTVKTNTLVTEITEDTVTTKSTQNPEEIEQIAAKTIIWAAGVKASPLGSLLAEKTDAELDRIGRVVVGKNMEIPTCPNVYIVGDLANYCHEPVSNGNPLPGVAPVAMQQGDYVAKVITNSLKGLPTESFQYHNKGSMAVIGRNAAVAELGKLRFDGLLAWLAWLFVHVMHLVEFDNKILVIIQWFWSYWTKRRGARLITQ